MIKILWLLKSKINSDFINKISDELELKVQISSSFEKKQFMMLSYLKI